MKLQNSSVPAADLPFDLISVGYIVGAYGIQGWVRIHSYSVDASALLHAKTWWLGRSKAGSEQLSEVRDVEVLQIKQHGEDVVACIMGVADRNAAEALKGNAVQIRRSHFPVLTQNEFYWLDLIGLAVENLQGESLGVVIGLLDNGAHAILRVAQPVSGEQKPEDSKQEYLIPFIDRFVPTVDQKNKKITVDWGLDF